jgi:hypothetical protein
MASSTGALSPRAGTLTPVRSANPDRRFYSAMAVAIGLTALAGFGRTYYLRSAAGGTLSPLLRVHGAVFTGWLVLFLVQVRLVAARRVDLHRRLGAAGAVFAVLVIVLGLAAAFEAAKRGFAPPGAPPPLVFFAIPVGAVTTFAMLVAAAIYWRRRPDVHKRLMLMATIAVITPGIARLPGIAGSPPPVFFAVNDLFVVACLVYDWMVLGRVHRATAWGAGIFVLSQPVRILIGFSAPWLAFARWITG